MWEIKPQYLLFLDDSRNIKTARGILDWRPERVCGKYCFKCRRHELDLPELTFTQAVGLGCRTLVIGVASRGGRLPKIWVPSLIQAVEAGLDIANGLHTPLTQFPNLVAAAKRCDQRLLDVRTPPMDFEVGRGSPRRGLRLLTVGTDCRTGKMYTALCLEREMAHRGYRVDFRATGQTGIFISGSGISVDAVVSDFVSGAAEWLSPENEVDHWDIIEGQGSIHHPGFAGVTFGLIHGSQPDALVLCHDPERSHIRGYPDFPIPPLDLVIQENIYAAKLTNPKTCCIGVAMNTSRMTPSDASELLNRTEQELGMSCVDPVRTGVGPLVDALASRFGTP